MTYRFDLSTQNKPVIGSGVSYRLTNSLMWRNDEISDTQSYHTVELTCFFRMIWWPTAWPKIIAKKPAKRSSKNQKINFIGP